MIGQGPGETEASTGQPFTGPSGERLTGWLLRAKVDPTTVYFDNIVRCWLPRPPKAAEIKYCWSTYVLPSLLELEGSPVIVPCGMPATKFILKGSTARVLGAVQEISLR